jgi:Holliday junction resolvase
MPNASKQKGDRVERGLVSQHLEAGLRANRVDARLGQFGAGKSHDIDIYINTRLDPLQAEVKARKNGEGFKTLEDWLGDNDALFLKRNNADPMVVVPMAIWLEILGGVKS